MTTGERDLATLLASLRPVLHPGSFVFVTRPAGGPDLDARPVVTVVEDEGVTLVLAQAEADRLGLDYPSVTALVTLQVHSSLDAVGLTAAVAAELTAHGISCNVVAGYFHDHLFVPVERGAEVVRLLRALAECDGVAAPPVPGAIAPTAVVAELSVRRGREAVAFYEAAFGALEVYRVGGTDEHPSVVSQLVVGDATFWVSDEAPDHGHHSPESLTGTTVRLLLCVEDPDAVVARAVGTGAREVAAVTDEHGWRLGVVEDPFGHRWEIGRPLIGWPPAHRSG